MKIKSLWVSEYKNLKNIDLTFDDNPINLMIGQNGLGKSNLIEIITLIFKDLDLASTKEELIQKSPFDYHIIYELHNHTIVDISIQDDILSIISHCPIIVDEVITFSEFKRRSSDFLPKRIIGYYSGENKRLQNVIAQYINKEKSLQIRAHRNTLKKKSFRRIFFAENYHSQLILLVLAIYRDESHVAKLLSEEIDIDNINTFDITFSNPRNKRFKNLVERNNTITQYEERALNGDFDFHEYNFWGLRGNVDKLLNVLFDYAFGGEGQYYIEDDIKRAKHIKERLIFTNLNTAEVGKVLIENFSNPIDLFDALESCIVLGILDSIKLNIRKIGATNQIEYASLSEGEQQMICVVGMMLITVVEQDVLYLLDEPDTHINPKWQREYIRNIFDAMRDDISQQIFISTHSSLLVQSNDKNVNTLLFRKDGNDIKIDTHNYSIDNWKIGQVLMSEYFDLPSSRPASIDELMNLRTSLVEKGELTSEEEVLLKGYENELGFLPTGETISEIKSMAYIFDVARKLQEREEGEK